VTIRSDVGEYQVCLTFLRSATGEAQIHRQDEAAFDDLSGRPYVTARSCAITLSTRISYLPTHSRVSNVFSTLRAISENNLSHVMYTVHLHPTSSLLTYLAGTTGSRPRPILRSLFFARSFFMAAPAAGRRVREVAESMRRRRQRVVSEDGYRAVLPSVLLEPLRTLRGLDFDQRSWLDANPVLARSHTFDPAAGCDAAVFRPCSGPDARLHAHSRRVFWGRVPARRRRGRQRAPIVVGRYLEDVYCDGNVRRRFSCSHCYVLIARRSPDTPCELRGPGACPPPCMSSRPGGASARGRPARRLHRRHTILRVGLPRGHERPRRGRHVLDLKRGHAQEGLDRGPCVYMRTAL
jgi:hypothetical protein